MSAADLYHAPYSAGAVDRSYYHSPQDTFCKVRGGEWVENSDRLDVWVCINPVGECLLDAVGSTSGCFPRGRHCGMTDGNVPLREEFLKRRLLG